MKTQMECLLAFCETKPGERFDQSVPFARDDGYVYFSSGHGALRIARESLGGVDLPFAETDNRLGPPFPPVDKLPVWQAEKPPLSPLAPALFPKPCNECQGAKTLQPKRLCPTCDGTGRHNCNCKFCDRACTHCSGAKMIDDGPPQPCAFCAGTGADAAILGAWLFDRDVLEKAMVLPDVRGAVVPFRAGERALYFTFADGEGIVMGMLASSVERLKQAFGVTLERSRPNEQGAPAETEAESPAEPAANGTDAAP